MNNNISLGNFNWDASTNELNIDFFNEFMNIFPMPPRSQNIQTTFNPFLDNSNNSWEDILTNSFMQRNPYKKVTTDKAIENIKKVKFNDSFEQKECPITMVEFEEGEIISELPCKHVFNTKAINRWLKEENYKCPVCRYEMDSKEVKKYDISYNDLSFNNFTQPLDELSGNRINTVLPNLDGNNFENIIIGMLQNQIRRNYQDTHFNQLVQEMESELDYQYNDDLQTALWESLDLDTNN
jgi:hypothetical protein